MKKKPIYIMVRPGKWAKLRKSKNVTVHNLTCAQVVAVVVAADEAVQNPSHWWPLSAPRVMAAEKAARK
jgi:hypothetical protein